MSAAAVTSTDRLSFALFLALVIHAMLILGISFSASDRSSLSKTLEVTLASYKSDSAPEQADFIAQENQQGSGTLDEAKMLTTDMEANFHDNQVNETSPQEQQATAPKQPEGKQRLVSTSGKSRLKTQLQQTDIPPTRSICRMAHKKPCCSAAWKSPAWKPSSTASVSCTPNNHAFSG